MNNEQINTQTYERAWGAPVGALDIPDAVWFDLAKEIPTGPVLEIGAGIKPSVPIRGNHFLDISKNGIKKLEAKGGIGKVASVMNTGYADQMFKAIFALEIFEHVENDLYAFLESKRVLSDDGYLVFSVPVQMRLWTPWDEMASHVRRYEPEELESKLNAAGFDIIKYKTRRSFARKWSVPFPIWVNTKFPNTAMFLAHYFAFYPARAMGKFVKVKWKMGPKIKISKNSAGVTIVAKKRNP